MNGPGIKYFRELKLDKGKEGQGRSQIITLGKLQRTALKRDVGRGHTMVCME